MFKPECGRHGCRGTVLLPQCSHHGCQVTMHPAAGALSCCQQLSRPCSDACSLYGSIYGRQSACSLCCSANNYRDHVAMPAAAAAHTLRIETEECAAFGERLLAVHDPSGITPNAQVSDALLRISSPHFHAGGRSHCRSSAYSLCSYARSSCYLRRC